MIKAVLFDLDGTLTDTLPDLYESVNYALKQCGIPEVSLEKVRMSIGNGASLLIARVTRGFPEKEKKRKGFSASITGNTERRTRGNSTEYASCSKISGKAG